MDPKREIFAQITTHWGTPEIDLFATRLNTQLPKFVSWKLTQPYVLWMHLQLVGNPCIFMPLHLSVNSQMPAKDFGGTSTSGNHDPTTLAYSSLVATTAENVNCNPICLAEAGGPTFTITLS